ncbi:MAG: glycerol-3-phosphate dehydrogenase/oxidase [Saprospiraceae bacterium]|nr:glycerol-3-phosphate dehydrogenase/oxidase [Saprospiraceae bacterium]
MNRTQILSELKSASDIDILVIGGGASGLGVALDGMSRGFKVAVLEKVDFGKGTSSKATKLLHGGVRYLQNGDVGLVIEALREREFVLTKASHLSRIQKFVIPHYSHWEGWYYWAGLKTYDLLSANRSLGRTSKISKEETLQLLPNLKKKGLKGGIVYTDGQFDDTRLCIDLVSTLNNSGSLVINYCSVDNFIYGSNDKIVGAIATDHQSGESFEVKAKCIVNATGVFAEQTMAIESEDTDIKIVPARGSHVVIDRSFLQSDEAIMIPKTSDGRVLFLVPWKNVVIMGTTDVVSKTLTMEPKATDEEIDFILKNASQYLEKVPTRKDILSTFAGLRPLAAPKKEGRKSKEISRSHKVVQSKADLFSILGGKWTTFRKMGEDTIDAIIDAGKLSKSKSHSEYMDIYNGSTIENGTPIHEALPYSWEELKHYIQNEWVEHAEDLLCRRSRCILLHKEATLEILDQAIELIATHHGYDTAWQANERERFLEVADAY